MKPDPGHRGLFYCPLPAQGKRGLRVCAWVETMKGSSDINVCVCVCVCGGVSVCGGGECGVLWGGCEYCGEGRWSFGRGGGGGATMYVGASVCVYGSIC